MNIIKDLQRRIAGRLLETKTPCKTYATEVRADMEGETAAQRLADYFAKDKSQPARPAMYVVVYIPELDRWTYCLCITEVLGRTTSTGGYIGIAGDVYTF